MFIPRLFLHFTVAVLFGPVISVGAIAGDPTEKFIIDFGNEEKAQAQAENLRARLSDPTRTVELDLTILPNVSNGVFDYRTTFTRSNAVISIDVRCDDGWSRFLEPDSLFSIDFAGVDNHLFLAIRHSDARAAPYSTIACEYTPDELERPAFVVRGYFAKSILNIPTAVDVELRPLTR